MRRTVVVACIASDALPHPARAVPHDSYIPQRAHFLANATYGAVLSVPELAVIHKMTIEITAYQMSLEPGHLAYQNIRAYGRDRTGSQKQCI